MLSRVVFKPIKTMISYADSLIGLSIFNAYSI